MSCSVHIQFPAGKPIEISVNDVVIARDAIVREMQHHPAEKPIVAWGHAARALVIRELLLQRAEQLDIAPAPIRDAAGRLETDDEARIRGVIEREVVVPEPDDETCQRYYERNQARFRSAEIFEASHILFPASPENRESYEQARTDATAVLATLKENPGRFAALARTYSRCPSAEQGGNLGQIIRGQTTPEFEQALVALEPGAFCDAPVATRYGFHIIRLDCRHDGRLLPYQAVSGRIAEYLRESVRRRADAQFIARLASAAQIKGIDIASAEALRVH